MVPMPHYFQYRGLVHQSGEDVLLEPAHYWRNFPARNDKGDRPLEIAACGQPVSRRAGQRPAR